MATKTITVEQFKAWLEGIEEMQPKNWAPNVGQWKKIRNKIKLLEETGVRVEQRVSSNNQSIHPISSGTDRGENTIEAPVPSSSFDKMQVQIDPTLPSTLQPNTSKPTMLPDTLQRTPTVKTPDIDTSSGKYESKFA